MSARDNRRAVACNREQHAKSTAFPYESREEKRPGFPYGNRFRFTRLPHLQLVVPSRALDPGLNRQPGAATPVAADVPAGATSERRDRDQDNIGEELADAGAGESAAPRCIFCGCTDSHACIIPLSGFDAAGRPYTRADTETCSWISLEPPVCSAPPCRERFAAGDAARVQQLQELEPLPHTPLDRIGDVRQLLIGATKGPGANVIVGGASYGSMLEQLQLAAEEVAEMQLELQEVRYTTAGGYEVAPSGADSVFREVLERIAERRRDASPYRVEPQADGAR